MWRTEDANVEAVKSCRETVPSPLVFQPREVHHYSLCLHFLSLWGAGLCMTGLASVVRLDEYD